MLNLFRILAIDFGTKKIGLAISDDKNSFSIPYLELENNKDIFIKLKQILEFENIKTIILGFPKTYNNYVSQRHEIILNFYEDLKKNFSNLEIKLVDESYSTKNVYNNLKNFEIKKNKIKKNKDMLAASNILETYLNQLDKK